MRACLLLLACLAVASPATDPARSSLANEDVIRLVKAGFSEGVVLHAISIANAQFDVTPDALASLKKSGVAEGVITAMVKAATGSPEHLRLLDPGIYVKRPDAYALVEAEPIIWRNNGSAPEGLFLRAALLGRVENRNSHLWLTGAGELLLVPEPGRRASEYQLLRAEAGEDWREFRAEAAMLQGKLLGLSSVDKNLSVEVDETFDLGVRVKLTPLRKGEYGLIPVGVTANGQLVPANRIYTFTIE